MLIFRLGTEAWGNKKKEEIFYSSIRQSQVWIIGLSKCKEDHYSERLNLSSCEKKAGIRTLTRLCDTGERRSNQLN